MIETTQTRTRWRQILHDGDPAAIRLLTAAPGIIVAGANRDPGLMAETTLDGSDTSRFMLAESAGALLGFAAFDRVARSRASFEIHCVAGAPAIAAELIDKVVAFAARKGALQVFAEASAGDHDRATRDFYLRLGFDETARLDDYYDAGEARVMFRRRV